MNTAASSTKSEANEVSNAKIAVNESVTRTARYTALTALILYVLAWATVMVAGVTLPGLADPMCFGILADKHKILDQTPSPKIVFVGGSNLLFGIDGVQIGKGLNRPVVNMGLCLMFPLTYLFEEVKDNINPGDVIVLSPEYADFSNEYASPLAMADILDVYPQAWKWVVRSNSFSRDEFFTFLGHVKTLGLTKLDYASRHMSQILQNRCKWTHAKYDPNLDVLNKKNLDQCGDLTWHLKRERNNSPSEVLFFVSKSIDPPQANAINSFAKFCESRKAKFVMIPPSVSTKQYAVQKPLIDKLIAESRKKLVAPWVAPPERYVFPVKMIFNNQYHLNNIGRPIRSARMIEDLRATVSAAEIAKQGKP